MSVQVDARQQRAHTGSQDTCARASSLLPVPPAPRTPRAHHTLPQGTYVLEVTEEAMHRQAPAQPMRQQASSSATTMSAQVDARQQRAHTGSQDTCARASSLLPVPPPPHTCTHVDARQPRVHTRACMWCFGAWCHLRSCCCSPGTCTGHLTCTGRPGPSPPARQPPGR
jgi:hypothetical protein